MTIQLRVTAGTWKSRPIAGIARFNALERNGTRNAESPMATSRPERSRPAPPDEAASTLTRAV